ncbi:bifunctional glutamate N-acetyltransferase/amino-acid acetyltransferase ArgJ [Desulfopila aestuarii]|uniref:Arginine biosynthesis bifunctional protein ArgJ n=1 Tax=Desulfopila aestuarii DSM 18488 TaxID=1121416 RepID=A0A1M7YD81_9BACT|nr:bifunctional glutamate N-acetyltransferase/amino-acid acetyltransferase ArgJ [Desulfopila aestuarii]SHO50539.1 glutamate N-acetyltransferase [Desulfopila aestuarii DSM 18488]
MGVKGFLTSAVAAGIKYQDRLDLGLIYSTNPAVTAGAFTTNQVKAAPVVIDMERLKHEGRAQAVLVNSGCANACTGKQGMADALQSSSLVAKELDIPENMVQLSSTGVIGAQLNMEAITAAIPKLVAGLGPDNFEAVAQAIMTTDTVKKTVRKTVMIGDTEVTLMGMAKGAGMIMPNMATMLSFVLTDVQIGFPELQKALLAGVERTFNRITVDGDTSTNDMVLVMASGEAKNDWIDEDSKAELELFQDTLESVLKELALMIVADGEGASKCITIRVCGAREDDEAEQVARTVANSNLVKTAFFGEDANWGRIIAAMGRSGVKFNPDRVDIAFNDVVIVRNGLAVGKEAEDEASKVLKERNFNVCIDLKEGNGCEEVYTCDFSIDYVKINADYRS